MDRHRLRTPHLLAGAIAPVAAVACLGGLFLEGLYRDNTWITAAWKGTDLVTLGVALPLLVVGLALSARGSLRGRLVLLAMLAYVFYGYQFYLFGAAFNLFFLLYVALVGFSLYALLFLGSRLDVADLAARFQLGAPARAFAIGYLLLTAAGLGVLWIAMSLGFVFTGRVPGPVEASGHPTGVVFALDLTWIVPALVLGAVWLWRRRPWGYVLATALTVKGAVYTLGLTSATLASMRAQVAGAGAELPIWAGLTVAGAIAAFLLLKAVRTPAA